MLYQNGLTAWKVYIWVIKMFNSFTKWVARRASKLTAYRLPLFIVYGCLLYLVSSFLLFILAWICKWLYGNSPDLNVYLEYLKILTSPPTLAFVGWLCKMGTDRDNNGVPDELEKELDKNE